MNESIDDTAGLQSLIDRGDTFSNKAAFFNPVNTEQNLQPVFSLATFIGMSNIIYGAVPAVNSLLTINDHQYTVVDVKNDPANNYQGMLLHDATTDSYFVVNRGTQESADWLTDAEMAILAVNNQWSDALALAKEAVSKASPTGATVYAVGHSLGGSLAQMQAAEFGFVGYTFNAYGASDVFDGLGLTKSSNATIYNYRNLFDVVSDASTHLGNQPIVLETAADQSLLASGASASPEAIYNTIKGDHSMSTFFTSTSDTDHNKYVQANAFSSPASGQTVALAEDLVSGLALSLGAVASSLLTGSPEIIPFGDLHHLSPVRQD